MAQKVNDLTLSLLWCECDPWSRNFHMPWMQQKKKNKTNKQKKTKQNKTKKTQKTHKNPKPQQKASGR